MSDLHSPTHLRSVGHDQQSGGHDQPDFEGQTVDMSRIHLAAVNKLEAENWHRIDDVVRMYVEGKVIGVHHSVDGVTGKLIRVHTIKVVDAVEVDWNHEVAFRGE